MGESPAASVASVSYRSCDWSPESAGSCLAKNIYQRAQGGPYVELEACVLTILNLTEQES